MSAPDFLKGECSHCAGHLEFPAAAVGNTIHCPHCGQPTELTAPPESPSKTSSRPGLGITTGVAIFLSVGIGAVLIFFKKSSPPVVVEKPLVASAPVEVPPPLPEAVRTNEFAIATISLEKEKGDSLVYVTGQLRNLAARQRFGVKLEFALFDKKNQPVGQATDYQQILEPHGEWKFKALVLDSKAVSAQFGSIHEDQ